MTTPGADGARIFSRIFSPETDNSDGQGVATVGDSLWIAARIFLGALLVAGCCRPPPRTPVTIVRVDRACLTEPPEPEGAVPFTAGGEGACPAAFGACFSDDQIAALIVELSGARTYARRAFALCGTTPAPDAGPP